MKTSIYPINKNINKPIEFRGLQAQYIWYLGASLLALLILFSILYILGVNTYMCLLIIITGGLILTKNLYQWSNRYGTHGMMKMWAKRRMPKAIKNYDRAVFYLNTERRNGI